MQNVVPIAKSGAFLTHGKLTTVAAGDAAPLDSSADCEGGIIVQNQDATNDVYLGGPEVTASTGGLRLAAGSSVALPIGNPSKIYVYSASVCVVGWVGVK